MLRVIGKTLLGLVLLLVLLVVVLVANSWRQGSRQIEVAPLAPIVVDEAAAGTSLAAAVRARTASGLPDPAPTALALDELQAHLRARYPLIHERLQREVVGGHTLVFKWTGSDAAARPFALMAHQDVVPVAPGTEALWQHPPFDGVIADGFVWGRGTWDDKGNLIAQLEAVEMLLASGFEPRRTVYLIFGHDEEVGGHEGAAKVAPLFAQRGIELGFVLDEGLLITEGIMPGLAPPAALIGVAEKGYASLRLTSTVTGGHSSMPPPGGSAIGVLAAALARLESNPMPARIQGVARQMFEAVAPEMSGAYRVALTNLWLTAPLLEPTLAKGAGTNAMMRTTTALTVFDAGNKENVIPGRAQAVVNFRLLPGDTVQEVVAHVNEVVADSRIEVEVMPEGSQPSPVSATDSDAYRLVERTVREVFPDAIVAPGLMLGGTDARHMVGVADQVLRFSPVRAGPDDLPRFHGNNERLSLDNLADMIRFYHRLVQQAAS